jgi:hypothetical protein
MEIGFGEEEVFVNKKAKLVFFWLVPDARQIATLRCTTVLAVALLWRSAVKLRRHAVAKTHFTTTF